MNEPLPTARAAAPGRLKQGPTKGHEAAPSWPLEGRSPYSASRESSSVRVMGAGAIGCWLGGCLQAADAPVVFVGRPSVLAGLRTRGLTLTKLEGRDQHIRADSLDLHEQVPPELIPQN